MTRNQLWIKDFGSGEDVQTSFVSAPEFASLNMKKRMAAQFSKTPKEGAKNPGAFFWLEQGQKKLRECIPYL